MHGEFLGLPGGDGLLETVEFVRRLHGAGVSTSFQPSRTGMFDDERLVVLGLVFDAVFLGGHDLARDLEHALDDLARLDGLLAVAGS